MSSSPLAVADNVIGIQPEAALIKIISVSPGTTLCPVYIQCYTVSFSPVAHSVLSTERNTLNVV